MDYLLYGLTVFALITLLYRMSLWIARKRKPSDVLLAVTVVGFLIFVGVEFLQETALIASSEIHFLIADWSYTIAIVALLIGLGLAIRESKPVINQSPQVLSYLPVLLLVVHPLVQDTLVIRELLLDLYTISAFFNRIWTIFGGVFPQKYLWSAAIWCACTLCRFYNPAIRDYPHFTPGNRSIDSNIRYIDTIKAL